MEQNWTCFSLKQAKLQANTAFSTSSCLNTTQICGVYKLSCNVKTAMPDAGKTITCKRAVSLFLIIIHMSESDLRSRHISALGMKMSWEYFSNGTLQNGIKEKPESVFNL